MHDTTTPTRNSQQCSLPLPPAPTPRGAGNAEATGARAASIALGRYRPASAVGTSLVTAAEGICTIRHEHLRWQLRATWVLADLLTMAIRDALPRIGWAVGSVGANVAGRCYGRTTAERRREFQAWCAAVGATLQPEITDWIGITHLRAVASCYDGLVDVVVMADLFQDEEDDQ